MGKILSSFMGGSPTVPVVKPVRPPKPVDTAPVVETEDAGKKAKALRTALYATTGGAGGEEILSGGVSRRQTLLGN